MKKQRYFFTTILVIALVFSNVIAVSAVVGVNVDETAVYINGNFDGQSAIVKGDIYSATGNIQFNSSRDNAVSGTIYHNQEQAFIIPNNYSPEFSQRVVPLETTYFHEGLPELADFPVIDHYVASYVPEWNTPALTVSQDTHFGTLSVGKTVTVDVREKDITMVVDNLSFNWGFSIDLIGTGNLYLYINKYIEIAPITINNGANPDRTYIISNNSISHNNLDLYAHVFYNEMTDLNLKGKITGSVVTNSARLTLSGGGNVVNGLLYAPIAEATLSSPDVVKKVVIPNVTGRIVASSIHLTGNGTVEYNQANSTLVVPNRLLMHEVSVQTNISGAGVVTPTYSEVAYGQVVHISATPNEGYALTGFTSSDPSMIPDASGNITVIDSVTITANFQSIQLPDPDYVNGLLGEYYDASELTNASALKVKRIDANVAFNFGFDAPHSTIEPESYSMRWSGYIKPTVSGSYTFSTYSDDGVMLYIDGNTVIDNWGALSLEYTVAPSTVYLEAGEYYPIVLEYQQMPLYAAIFLFWEAEGVPTSIVPSSVLFVPQSDYDAYAIEQYYNPLQRVGTGFTNKFYTVNGNRTPNELMHTEMNNIDYKWGWDAPPGISDDTFYGEMSGFLEAKFSEATTLSFAVDDGIRVWVEDQLVIDKWDWHNVDTFQYTFNATAGEKYKIRVEYIELGLGGTCIMGWAGESVGGQIIPIECMYPEE